MATFTTSNAFDTGAFLTEASLGSFFTDATVITKIGTTFALQLIEGNVIGTLTLTGTFGNYVDDQLTTGTGHRWSRLRQQRAASRSPSPAHRSAWRASPASS